MSEENKQKYHKKNTDESASTTRLWTSLWQYGTIPWTVTKRHADNHNVSLNLTSVKNTAIGWIFGKSPSQRKTDAIERTRSEITVNSEKMTCSSVDGVYHDTGGFDSGFVSDVEKPEVNHVDSRKSVRSYEVSDLCVKAASALNLQTGSVVSVQNCEELSNNNNTIDITETLFTATDRASNRLSTYNLTDTSEVDVSSETASSIAGFLTKHDRISTSDVTNFVQDIVRRRIRSSTPKRRSSCSAFGRSVFVDNSHANDRKNLVLDQDVLHSYNSEDLTRHEQLAHQIEDDEANAQATLNEPCSDLLRVVSKLDKRLSDLRSETVDLRYATKTVGKELHDTEEMASRLMKEMRELRSNLREMAYLDELIHLLKGQLDRITLRKWPFRISHLPLQPGEEANFII